MSNPYYNKLEKFREKLRWYAEEIFSMYDKELRLMLECCNLLKNKNNVIESSTATGFVIEEFLVSMLEKKTIKNDKRRNEYKVQRLSGSTTKSSYDCWAKLNGNVMALINIKAQKEGRSKNEGVAAINKLYDDYVKTDPQKKKCYVILKIHYKFDESKKDRERKIFVGDIDVFALEEVDFKDGWRQDYRNWSKKFKDSSGRLKVSDKFRKEHPLAEEEISYEKTAEFIKEMIGKPMKAKKGKRL